MNRTAVALNVRPLTGTIGAEITGVRLAEADEQTWASIRQLWLEHLVLFFPDQHLTPDEHVALGRRLGEPEIHPFIPKLDDKHPEIVVLDSDRGAKADTWHTDVTFSPTPPMASILQVTMSPPHGGDTMWSNQYLAYEELSAPWRDLLEGLTATHWASPFGHPEITATHPVVRVHPETGRRALFVNRTFTSRIVQMRPAESDAILSYLYDWSEQPRFVCRYRWSEGAVGLWDNRCTQHHAVDDYERQRVIQRVTVLGDVPVGEQPRWEPFAGSRNSSSEHYGRSDRTPVAADTRTNSVRLGG